MDRDELYLGQMLDFSRKALAFIEGKSREEYDNDEILRIALAHLLQTVGEAARRISDSFREAHPEIPWRSITGMRHHIVHDYVHIDNETVWDTIHGNLPELIIQLEAILGEQE
jgi:uncharacterized protein with HEPN domain